MKLDNGILSSNQSGEGNIRRDFLLGLCADYVLANSLFNDSDRSARKLTRADSSASSRRAITTSCGCSTSSMPFFYTLTTPRDMLLPQLMGEELSVTLEN